MTDHLMHNYARLPVAFERGEGPYLFDAQGRRYLDALSGIAVCSLGHAHPRLAEALAAQAKTLLHTSNLYRIPLQEALAERLCALSGMTHAFFCNSGAEANEAAIKLARLYGHRRDVATPRIVVMDSSFHGRTLGALAATGNPAVQAGFEPLLPGFVRVPFDDLGAVERAATEHDDIVAVLVEPVQGEGGVRVPAPDYLTGLRALCDQHGWLLMLDEVQTGVGRTGRWFAFQHGPAQPDVLLLAKALGNGVPIGALLARGAAAEVLGPGTHGSTFGGNPLACRAALTVLDVLAGEDLVTRAGVLGERLRDGLHEALAGLDGVCEVRGLGAMVGLELDRPCGELVARALEERQLLINVTAGRVVRLLPPLVLSDAEADTIVRHVADLIRDFLSAARS